MIELTFEQPEALTQNGAEPARVIDRAPNTQYVLVRADLYHWLKSLFADDLPNASHLINEVMAEDDAKDPYLDSYQHDAREVP